MKSQKVKFISGKINDLSNSKLRKRFFDTEFVPENNIAIESIRVSTKRQERGQSFEDQAETNQEYLKKAKLNVVKSWEVAESASKHDARKHFHEMIEFIHHSQKTTTRETCNFQRSVSIKPKSSVGKRT